MTEGVALAEDAMSIPEEQPEADRSARRLLRVAEPARDLPAEDDAALVAAARARAPRAAARLWDRYSSLVRRILRRSLGPSVDVEDAVQEVFLRLFRDLDSLREPTALRSFTIGITLHVATSELRRRRARKWLHLSDDGRLPEPASTEDDGEREALARLYRVLDRVSPELRLTFVLRQIEGLELTELSAVLGCSLSTTKRRVAEASSRVCRLAAADPLLARYVNAKEGA